ncbi:MAG: putative beta-lysine N-acetyltransferase [Phycisphaerae bacterium]
MTPEPAPSPDLKDTIEIFGASKIQHGQLNRRIYLMKLDYEDANQIVPALDGLAFEHGYTKIFAKVPRFAKETFGNNGYEVEAHIPEFYEATEDVYMMCRYLDPARADEGEAAEKYEEVLKASKDRQGEGGESFPDDVEVRLCKPEDAEPLAELYAEVFPTYPFPIDQPSYITQTMETHVRYFGVWRDGKMIAASSSEMDQPELNTEMTDFATLPDQRGEGLATALLGLMEEDARQLGLHVGYTIARSPSFGMNITFARMGYEYAGRLKNNTNISGQFESMNVWYKKLKE